MRPSGLFCIIASLSMFGQEARLTNIEDLLKGLRESEWKLQNLRVDGKCLFLKWDARKQDWKYNGESDVTAWYSGLPKGKARVDIHKHIAPWQGGAGFGQSSGVTANNGRVGQSLFLEEGTAGNTIKTLYGRITAELPFLDDAGASGWEYSLYGCLAVEKQRMSEFVERGLESQLIKCVLKGVTIENLECIELMVQRINAGTVVSTETWVLDPSRGYAIISYEGREGHSTVEKLVEPAPGVYYPARVTSVSKDGRTKTIYQASEIVANDPNFSEDIFNIKWPAGTEVDDEISGTRFTVGPSSDETERTISNQVEEVRAALTNPPTPPAMTAPTSRESSAVVKTRRSSPASYWFVAMIPLVGIALLVVALKIRKK